MTKAKKLPPLHLIHSERDMAFTPVECECRTESSLDCPDTLREFEDAILELFPAEQGKPLRLN